MSCSDRPFRTGIALVVLLTGSIALSAEPTEVVPPGLLKRQLRLDPSGDGLVYNEAISGATLHIKKFSFADKSESIFRKTGRETSFSADGSVVAITQQTGRLSTAIEIEDSKRNKKCAIIATFITTPAVSPDGRHVVVAMNYETLYAVDLNVAEPKKGKGKLDEIPVSPDPKAKQVTGVTRLSSPDAVGDCFPSFSPDGKTVVFATRRDNDYEIYSIRLDGTGLTRLTSTPGIDSHPVYSPDGKRIAFTSNRDLNYEIYVMNADGSNPQRVTNHPERDDYPCWSKDGREIFFVGERNGKYGIYRVAAP